MAEKKELTPELAEKLKAAKTPEELGKILGVDLKAYEKSPLSPDELDTVAGGDGMQMAPDDYLVAGLTRHEMITFLTGVAEEFGNDVAILYGKGFIASNIWEKIPTWGVAWCVDHLWAISYQIATTGKGGV